MREIKFRAWFVETQTMYSWEDLINRIGISESTFAETKLWKPMQSTGFKDKKHTQEFPAGEDIYAGDALAVIFGAFDNNMRFLGGAYSFPANEARIVEWNAERGQWFCGDTPLADCSHLFVIGNIHQNPKLLKKTS